jgi:hypothetical protein
VSEPCQGNVSQLSAIPKPLRNISQGHVRDISQGLVRDSQRHVMSSQGLLRASRSHAVATQGPPHGCSEPHIAMPGHPRAKSRPPTYRFLFITLQTYRNVFDHKHIFPKHIIVNVYT